MGILSKKHKKQLLQRVNQRNYKQKPEVKKRCRQTQLLRHRRNRDFIEKFKKGKECILCGYSDHHEILNFHHKNPKDKLFGLANTKTRSLIKIKTEIKKCVLLCANCHTWIHLKGRWVDFPKF